MLKANLNHTRNNKITIGDLCQAISNGTLPASMQDGEWYVVRQRDVRRLRASRSLQTNGQGYAA